MIAMELIRRNKDLDSFLGKGGCTVRWFDIIMRRIPFETWTFRQKIKSSTRKRRIDRIQLDQKERDDYIKSVILLYNNPCF